MARQNHTILNYEISGKGPVIVLLHGYLSSLRYWDELRSELEQDHTVVALDLLGFGNSPKPRNIRYSYDDHLVWIKRTLDYCGIHEPVLLAGHSMGALLALRYASTYSNAVHKLLLLNTPLFKNAREARTQLAGTNLFFRASLYWEMHRVIVPVMRSKAMKKILRAALPTQFKGMESYIFLSSVESRGKCLRNVIEAQNSLYDLAHIDRVPVTLVQGTKERPMYLHNLLRVTPKQDWQILLTDTGHHTPIENPELASGLLQAY